ncbi:hypothetical protein HELRODRAFT_174105 [Helobdella robusta]|uniref:EGF-like domain-containing protein n=1 Tax=Helobdella robusta TaxID=6412 RepID=T1F7M0_HELRO|nr:hypothetical protein HELRODRAFT_174105 [Helobdella robusta]ESO03206.1 hypothetical protein HELRODRAFT_174105 [Helobdella robusta]
MINVKFILALLFIGSACSSPYIPPKKTFMDQYVEVFLKHQCNDATAYACSKHGKGFCVVDDICLCSPGYTGKNCDEQRGVDPNFESCKRDEERSPFIRDWMEFNRIHTINVTWPSRTGVCKHFAVRAALRTILPLKGRPVVCPPLPYGICA